MGSYLFLTSGRPVSPHTPVIIEFLTLPANFVYTTTLSFENSHPLPPSLKKRYVREALFPSTVFNSIHYLRCTEGSTPIAPRNNLTYPPVLLDPLTNQPVKRVTCIICLGRPVEVRSQGLITRSDTEPMIPCSHMFCYTCWEMTMPVFDNGDPGVGQIHPQSWGTNFKNRLGKAHEISSRNNTGA